MKRILILSLVAILAVCAADARRKSGEKVGAEIPETAFDFGTVRQSGPKVEHDFTITVTGTSPVAILSANASCGCTVPSYDRKPVMPGKSSVIKVKFSPKGQRGEIDKAVRVRLRNGNNKSETVTLRLTGVVVPD